MVRSRREIESATLSHRNLKHADVAFGETQASKGEKDGILEDQMTPGMIGKAAKLAARRMVDPVCRVFQYCRHAWRIEIGASVVCAQFLEQTIDVVFLSAPLLQEREQIHLFIFEMSRKLV